MVTFSLFEALMAAIVRTSERLANVVARRLVPDPGTGSGRSASRVAASASASGARSRQVAYRMLGSLVEADDVAYDAWLRADRRRRCRER